MQNTSSNEMIPVQSFDQANTKTKILYLYPLF